MKRRLTLTFDEFGWEALESEAQREQISVDELIAGAAEYFEADLPSERMPMTVPAFARSPGRGGEQEIDLQLGARTWKSFREEAARQGVPLERLLEHAALYYVAAIHSAGLPADGLVKSRR